MMTMAQMRLRGVAGRSWRRALTGCLVLVSVHTAGLAREAKTLLRVGYFPNITHAQAVIGAHGTRSGGGWFEQRLGPDATIQWFPFNAGPSAMEAIFAGSIDLTYVGPNPALNAHIRSRGEEIRVLAGSAEGGAALVVPGDGSIRSAADFKGRRIASPQLGNTQDVSARVWLKKNGYRVTLVGGDVPVIPTANPDQLALFQSGRIDAVWTVEPWVSRLELEAGGRLLVEQRDTVTTVLVASAKFLRTQPELARRFVAAHRELTNWLRENPEAARAKLREGLSLEARREIPAALIARAWPRLTFTDRATREQFEALVSEARTVGFLRDSIPLDRLFPAQP